MRTLLLLVAGIAGATSLAYVTRSSPAPSEPTSEFHPSPGSSPALRQPDPPPPRCFLALAAPVRRPPVDPIILRPIFERLPGGPAPSLKIVGAPQPDGSAVAVDIEELSGTGEGTVGTENIRAVSHGRDMDLGGSGDVGFTATRTQFITEGGGFRLKVDSPNALTTLDQSPIDTSTPGRRLVLVCVTPR